MFPKQLMASLLATTVSVTLLAGCPSPAQNNGGTSAFPGANNATTGSGVGNTGGTPALIGNGPLTTGPSQVTPGTVTTKPLPAVVVPALMADDATTVGAPSQAKDAAAGEDEIEGYNAIADDEEALPGAGYNLLQAEAGPNATAAKLAAKKTKLTKDQRDKLLQRRETLRKRRLARAHRLRENEVAAVRARLKAAKWIDNGDGTLSKKVDVKVTRTTNGKTWDRAMTISRVIEKDSRDLIEAKTDIAENFAPGGLHTLHWNKTRQEDGSYDVVFQQLRRYGAVGTGPTRTADWHKIIDAAGKLSGTGTIIWTNKAGKETYREVITLNGTEEVQKLDGGTKTGTPEVAPAQDSEAPAVEAPITPVTPPATGTADPAATPAVTTAAP